jgi:hypothetical protein
MKSLLRPSNLSVAILLLAAVGFLGWTNLKRARHVSYISGLAQTLPLPVDPASPTGYGAGIRELIVPEHNNDSYQWLAQTQQMFAHKEWRLRQVDYDNAPYGREVRTPSPYRWWLGCVTWMEHERTGEPLGLAVEQAALVSDPVLQILLLIATVVFAAWCFGPAVASLLCLGFAALFPFAGSFLPGQVDDYGLSLAGALWSILPLLAGTNACATGQNKNGNAARRWFVFAGIVGGLCLWVSVTREIPVLLGISLGALFAAGISRRGAEFPPLPWRTWALAGGVTTICAFLAEYFPGHLALKAWHLEMIHPLYAISWLGAGELLTCFQKRRREEKKEWTRRDIVAAIIAALGFASAPVAILLQGDRTWFFADALASRLTALAGSPIAANTAEWLARDHFTAATAATFPPLLLIFPAAWLVTRRLTNEPHRTGLALALGPVLVTLGLACFHLRWWNFVDGSLLALIAATSLTLGASRLQWHRMGLAALLVLPGMALLVAPPGAATPADGVTETEIISLVERDLAHWLANRAGPDGSTVFAPPGLTTSLYFHGGLRGIATPYLENKDGLAAALHLAAATSADEAQVLIRNRKISHIIIPSWEPVLDEYARLGSNQPEHTLVGLLHHWLPPRWLRAIPYHLPAIPGFENQSVAVFEVTDIQDNVTALSGLAEYFAEMGMGPQAAAVRRTLEQSFPNDPGSLVAQAQVSLALRDGAAFQIALNTLASRLAGDDVQTLAWDRRVNLAIVLAEGKRNEAARAQLERCLAEADEPLLRSLPSATLYRLQALAKAFGLEIAEPTLRDLAHKLLPPEMRSAL